MPLLRLSGASAACRSGLWRHTEDPTAKVYVCAHYPTCDSYVAAHRATLLPMGTLANQTLRLVRWTIREYINVCEEIEGLGLEDLCQGGAIALCHAAATYQAGSVQFKTYAEKVPPPFPPIYCHLAPIFAHM